jgi:hypothetical protein
MVNGCSISGSFFWKFAVFRQIIQSAAIQKLNFAALNPDKLRNRHFGEDSGKRFRNRTQQARQLTFGNGQLNGIWISLFI